MIEKDQFYEKRLKIAQEAFDSGCMIFASDSQKWYTPREFVNSGEQLIPTGPDWTVTAISPDFTQNMRYKKCWKIKRKQIGCSKSLC